MKKFIPHSTHHRLAGLIVLLFLGLATTYSLIIPLFESPDELWHYPFVWQLARTGELPVQDPANPQLWQQEASQPPLYYALAALLTASVAADDLPTLIYPNPHADIGVVRPDGNANIVVHTAQEAWPWQGATLAVHLARFFSVLLGTGTLLTVYALGRSLAPAQPAVALTAMAFVAFNPMFIFIAASVNNDNLITLLATVIIWLLVRLILRVEAGAAVGVGCFIGLGLLGGLAALSKLSGLGLVGLTGLVLLWQGWRRRSWWVGIGGNVIVSGLVLLSAGWWYWRNIRLYDDWSGTAPMVQMMGARSIRPTLAQFWAELSGLVQSFWGLFGYFSVPMPSFTYGLLNGLFLIGLVGLLLMVILNRRALPLPLRQTWPLLIGWQLILLTGFIRWTLRTPATQGRLLFPMLGVLALLWALGWGRWPAMLGKIGQLKPLWNALPGLLMFGLAVWIPWGIIGPAYARPPLINELPATAQPLEATFGDHIQLLGYASPVTTTQPGGVVPLTLYWRSEVPIAQDYTLFVHLLDEHDLVVAQRNVFHGPGVYPTSQWQPGRMFADRYSLRLPRTVPVPTTARFEVGLYDHTTGQRLPLSSGQDNLRFGQIEIEPVPDSELPNPQFLLFEQGITLTGYEVERRQLAPGESLTLTLYWQTQSQPDDDYKVFVHLVGEGDYRAAQHDSDPQGGAAPTSTWSPGQIIPDAHPLTVAADAPPGAYRLVVGLYEAETGQRLRLLRNGPDSVQADSITLSGVRVVK